MRDHFLYLVKLHERDIVQVAGPLGNDGGLLILRVRDRRAATEIVAADPAVKAGLFVAEIKPFMPRIGGRKALVDADPLLRP